MSVREQWQEVKIYFQSLASTLHVHNCVYSSILLGNITRPLWYKWRSASTRAGPYHLIINCMVECQVLIMHLKFEDWTSLASLGLAGNVCRAFDIILQLFNRSSRHRAFARGRAREPADPAHIYLGCLHV